MPYYYLNTAPPILIYLNRQRERFRDQFGHLYFVFVLPFYAIKYCIRCAPDFFDWSTGFFTLEDECTQRIETVTEILQNADHEHYRNLCPADRNQKILEIQSWLDEIPNGSEHKAKLLRELGRLFRASDKNEAALNRFNQAIELKGDYHEAWNNRGSALSALGRKEEAIASYDKAIEFKPDKHEAWGARGWAMMGLEKFEQALESFDKAIAIQLDFSVCWYLKAQCYAQLGEIEHAISAVQKAIWLDPDQWKSAARENSAFDNLRDDPRFQSLVNL
ncbi:MAG: tetratricopeptide repeat protein [Leptolyngbyaceae cyanobacterium MO_188.B28]|nr:tetratricopeptide repeat protein [Leptolyngbyaceae cyanobacterium MO_188.B28]